MHFNTCIRLHTREVKSLKMHCNENFQKPQKLKYSPIWRLRQKLGNKPKSISKSFLFTKQNPIISRKGIKAVTSSPSYALFEHFHPLSDNFVFSLLSHLSFFPLLNFPFRYLIFPTNATTINYTSLSLLSFLLFLFFLLKFFLFSVFLLLVSLFLFAFVFIYSIP